MKKTLFIVTVALTIGFFATSCSKDNPISCLDKLSEVTSAQQAYVLENSDANCIAYKNALEDYINCDGITDKVYYQSAMEALPCYQ